jgi:hypothetical protein
MAWIEIKKKRGGSQGRVDYAVRVNKHASGDLAIYLSMSFAKKMRWQVGDKVIPCFDLQSGVFGLKRTNSDDGFVMGTPGGKCKASSVGIKLKLDPKIMSRCVNGEARRINESEVVIDDDSNMFILSMLAMKEVTK